MLGLERFAYEERPSLVDTLGKELTLHADTLYKLKVTKERRHTTYRRQGVPDELEREFRWNVWD
jgi:hypothetical protein